MKNTVIVYGPMACGKTRNAEAVAAKLGLSNIVDDWREGVGGTWIRGKAPPAEAVVRGVPLFSTLVLTNEVPMRVPENVRVLPFHEAIKECGL